MTLTNVDIDYFRQAIGWALRSFIHDGMIGHVSVETYDLSESMINK